MTPERAYRLVRTAIKNGALVRPEACEKCGREPGPASDGRAQIHAHHHDYAKPLEVEWICAKCHREVTPLPKVMFGGIPKSGEYNGQSKLTWKDVRRIRSSTEKARVIAKELGVSPKSIHQVRRGERWIDARPTT